MSDRRQIASVRWSQPGDSRCRHGGSGTDEEDFQPTIKASMTTVHVDTELRIAWRLSLENPPQDQPGEIAPHKILPPVVVQEVSGVVENRALLFNFR